MEPLYTGKPLLNGLPFSPNYELPIKNDLYTLGIGVIFLMTSNSLLQNSDFYTKFSFLVYIRDDLHKKAENIYKKFG